MTHQCNPKWICNTCTTQPTPGGNPARSPETWPRSNCHTKGKTSRKYKIRCNNGCVKGDAPGKGVSLTWKSLWVNVPTGKHVFLWQYHFYPHFHFLNESNWRSTNIFASMFPSTNIFSSVQWSGQRCQTGETMLNNLILKRKQPH